MSILNEVPNERKIKAFVRKVVFGQRIRCPRCNSSNIRRSECRFRCPSCRKPFSLTSVSWLSGMKLS